MTVDSSSTPISSLKEEAAKLQLKLSSEQFALHLDGKDSLSHIRNEFSLPTFKSVSPNAKIQDIDAPCTYLCGNSLGLMSKKTTQMLKEEMDVWATNGVQGHWKHPHDRAWFKLVEQLSPEMAKIVGATESEIAVMNSLTVNLHLLMAAFYKPTKERSKIMYEHHAFPSDQFAFQSQAKWHGFDPEQTLIPIKARESEYTLRTEDIIEQLEKHGKETALVIFAGVQFYTGQFFDIPAITKKAKDMVSKELLSVLH